MTLDLPLLIQSPVNAFIRKEEIDELASEVNITVIISQNNNTINLRGGQ